MGICKMLLVWNFHLLVIFQENKIKWKLITYVCIYTTCIYTHVCAHTQMPIPISTCVRAGTLSCAWLSVAPWTIACQALLSMGFWGKSTGVGCHSLLQGIFLTQGSTVSLLYLLHWQAGSLPAEPPEKPYVYIDLFYFQVSVTGWIVLLKVICGHLNPQYLEMWPYMDSGSYRHNQVKVRSLEWALVQKPGVLIKRGSLNAQGEDIVDK